MGRPRIHLFAKAMFNEELNMRFAHIATASLNMRVIVITGYALCAYCNCFVQLLQLVQHCNNQLRGSLHAKYGRVDG